MRRILFASTLAGLLACTGCFTSWNAQPEQKTLVPAEPTSKAPPLVRPEQITPDNGHQFCEALEAEFAWEFQQRMLNAR
jgi:hypothetical protein